MLAALRRVKIAHLAGRLADRQTAADDAAGRGAGDHVEQFARRLAGRLLDALQNAGRDDPPDAAAVDAQDADDFLGHGVPPPSYGSRNVETPRGCNRYGWRTAGRTGDDREIVAMILRNSREHNPVTKVRKGQRAEAAQSARAASSGISLHLPCSARLAPCSAARPVPAPPSPRPNRNSPGRGRKIPCDQGISGTRPRALAPGGFGQDARPVPDPVRHGGGRGRSGRGRRRGHRAGGGARAGAGRARGRRPRTRLYDRLRDLLAQQRGHPRRPLLPAGQPEGDAPASKAASGSTPIAPSTACRMPGSAS